MKHLLAVAAAMLSVQTVSADDISDAVASEHRTPAYVERDEHRHPAQVLRAYGVESDDVIVEIWPGGGWYTEILAPLVSEEGRLYAAHFPADTSVNYYRNSRANFIEKLQADPVYGNVELVEMDPSTGISGVDANSADYVLTFRNVHNWLRNGNEATVFASMFDVLKPGGLLGVVEHEAKQELTRDEMLSSGYMPKAYVIEQAQAAGFELVDSFDINHNAADSTEHKGGVWALPPTLRNGDENREAFVEVGESHRMTLLFKKPE